VLILEIAAGVLVLAWFLSALESLRRLGGPRTVAGVVMHRPTDDTTMDESGAVKSIQGADIDIPREAFTGAWTAVSLERLARTYWAFLQEVTLGFIKVVYTPEERFVVFLMRPFVLLRFQAPEYELESDSGVVRWRIERGLLVARKGRGGNGYLEIDVKHLGPGDGDTERVHVEVEVANFYPQIASALSRWVYVNTQSRIHVLVTYGFLRRVAKRRLYVSKTGRFAG
jgi:hypothetical protein